MLHLLSPKGLVDGVYNYSGRPSTTMGTVLTAGSANVEGTVTELISATTHPITRLVISCGDNNANASKRATLLNIYIGSSMTHKLISNLNIAMSTGFSTGPTPGLLTYEFPIYLPAGTRIGGSLRCAIASVTCPIQIRGYNVRGWAGTRVETIGAVEASSEGTLITPGTSSPGTLTSVGTTTFNWKALIAGWAGNEDSSISTGDMTKLEIGNASAVINGLDYAALINRSNQEVCASVHGYHPRYVNIPSGTTLYGSAQSQGTSVDKPSLIIYGIG